MAELDGGNPFLKSLKDFKSTEHAKPVVKSASEGIDPFEDEPQKKKSWLQRLLAQLRNLFLPQVQV